MTKPPFGRENKPVSENFKAPDHLVDQLVDTDPTESAEWRQSFDAVLKNAGPVRARYLMLSLLQRANEKNVGVSGLRTTDYINTIPPALEPNFPGDEYLEKRIRAFIRWNAARPFMRLVLITSSAAKITPVVEIKYFSKDTPPLACMPELLWRAV
jgi:pyruvate dehydrogenase E1 component